MDNIVLVTRVRETKGKGAARKLRRNGQIPAIFYGPKTKPIMLTVDYPELERAARQGIGENIIVDIEVQSDQGTETRKTMMKDLLIDPVKDTYLHADFYEISMDSEITVGIPIRLLNTPVGIATGGVLQHIRRELTVSCLPGNLVDSLEMDASGLDIGDSLHVRDIELPEGITSAEQGHITIAVVAAPTVKPEEEIEEVLEEKAMEPVEKTSEES